MKLRPVLVPVPPDLRGRERIAAARRAGRLGLERAAELARLPGAAFPRDGDGVPLPPVAAGGGDGWSWSTSNADGLVAALVAPARAAVDLEPLDRPRVAPVEAFAGEREVARLERAFGTGRDAALRLWTAKEAVLKKARIGLAELSLCELEGVADDGALLLLHRGARHRVVQLAPPFAGSDRHLLAVAADLPGFELAPEALVPEAVG